jgi:hypothetical protein
MGTEIHEFRKSKRKIERVVKMQNQYRPVLNYTSAGTNKKLPKFGEL